MAQTRHYQTVGDYITIAISPILIMTMVGSLLYFLVEVLYVGKYEGRLLWILFWFVFGIVLIARMSMRDDLSYPWGAYGLVLGFVVWLAICRFVQFDPDTFFAPFSWVVNAGLMGIVWWAAHQLTWDCTYIDDQVDASGVGLMQAAGMERDNSQYGKHEERDEGPGTRDQGRKKSRIEPRDDDRSTIRSNKATTDSSHPSPLAPRPSSSDTQSSGIGWWERFRKYREEQRKKPHNPGVWVIYFSLAALPLFGLGQSLIPAEDEGRRRYVFWLMIVYLGSGLGLLLTTSFLGLRRYLRQRKVPMPKTIAGGWLATGGLLIAALLIGGALLPRPNAEYPLVDVSNLIGSKERQASRYASKGDSPGKGQGKASTDRPPDNEKGESGSGNKPDKQGGSQSQSKSGQQKGDSKSDQKGNSKDGQKDKSSSSNQKSNEDGKEKSDKDKQKKDKGNSERSSDSEDQDSKTKSPPSFHTNIASTLSSALKWIVFAILAVIVALYLFRHGLRYIASFTTWARRLLAALDALWQRLFGWWGSSTEAAGSEIEAPVIETPPLPFSSFANPFRDGSSTAQSPEELVHYSFEALEAWAREHDLSRTPEETALEFARRIGDSTPPLDADGKRLAGLYVRAAYARGQLTQSAIPTLRQFWERLETISEAPLSA